MGVTLPVRHVTCSGRLRGIAARSTQDLFHVLGYLETIRSGGLNSGSFPSLPAVLGLAPGRSAGLAICSGGCRARVKHNLCQMPGNGLYLFDFVSAARFAWARVGPVSPLVAGIGVNGVVSFVQCPYLSPVEGCSLQGAYGRNHRV